MHIQILFFILTPLFSYADTYLIRNTIEQHPLGENVTITFKKKGDSSPGVTNTVQAYKHICVSTLPDNFDEIELRDVKTNRSFTFTPQPYPFTRCVGPQCGNYIRITPALLSREQVIAEIDPTLSTADKEKAITEKQPALEVDQSTLTPEMRAYYCENAPTLIIRNESANASIFPAAVKISIETDKGIVPDITIMHPQKTDLELLSLDALMDRARKYVLADYLVTQINNNPAVTNKEAAIKEELIKAVLSTPSFTCVTLPSASIKKITVYDVNNPSRKTTITKNQQHHTVAAANGDIEGKSKNQYATPFMTYIYSTNEWFNNNYLMIGTGPTGFDIRGTYKGKDPHHPTRNLMSNEVNSICGTR